MPLRFILSRIDFDRPQIQTSIPTIALTRTLGYFPSSPKDWTFEMYNHGDNSDSLAFVADVEPIVVSHKQNRALVFDSDFFHRTAPSKFEQGHANRRINLTFLYGQMTCRGRAKCDQSA